MDCLFLIISLTLLNSAFCVTVIVTVTVGDDCELPCNSSGDKEVDALVWSHLHLGEKKRLLIYRGGRVVDSQDRVKLKHLQPKNDFSVILKNVTFEDRATYECRCIYEDRQKEVKQISLNIKEKTESAAQSHITGSTNSLNNNDDDDVTPRRYRGLGFGLLVALLLVVISLILLLKRKSEQCFRGESYHSVKPKKNVGSSRFGELTQTSSRTTSSSDPFFLSI